MFSGYIPCFAITLENAWIEKLRLKSYKEFDSTLKKYSVFLDDYANYIVYEGEIPFGDIVFEYDETIELKRKRIEDISEKYYSFIKEFKNKTNLTLDLSYHNSYDDGMECDDVRGGFYSLRFSEIYEFTDYAKNLAEIIDINTNARYVSHGYSNGAITINKDNLEKLNLKSFENFIGKLNEYEVDLDDFAKVSSKLELIKIEENMISRKNKGEVIKIATNELFKLFLEFQKEFKIKTNLSIELGHHDSRTNGDCHDNIDGHYFHLDFSEFYKETASARKLKEKVNFKTSNYVYYN